MAAVDQLGGAESPPPSPPGDGVEVAVAPAEEAHSPVPSASASEALSTVSTESVNTVRGLGDGLDLPESSTPRSMSVVPSRIASETPDLTTGTHEPFTALSPTIAPSPAKAAKHQISQDFKKAGYIPKERGSKAQAGDASKAQTAPCSKPDLVDLAVQLQSEPGLPHWWNQVTQVLGEYFGAERATLAVATDVTDVENVPWAQVATFSAKEDDELSKMVNDTQSPRSSLRDISSPLPFSVEGGKSATPTSATVMQKQRIPGGTGGSNLAARPKLETRHSYAGYPSRHKTSYSDFVASQSALSQKSLSPASLYAPTGFSSLDSGSGLQEDHLRYHEAQLAVTDSTESLLPGSFGSSRILHPQQPLEIEGDPLITSTGVLRVFGREHATVLTREYFGTEQENVYPEEKGLRSLPNPGRNEPKKSPSAGTKTRPATKRTHTNRRRLERSKASSAGGKSASKFEHQVAYEDSEQFPGTPWSQSPAPSPAARVDPDDNPFFSRGPDQDAFSENPPQHRYSTDSPIQAIGIDRACSIIHLPLIHPSARLSHTLNRHAVRDDSKTRSSSRVHAEHPPVARQDSTQSSDNLSANRIPIAILSILSPNVPYPADLVDSLNEMAPLLATSFYTARSHTNIIVELSAISGRRPYGYPQLMARDGQTLSNLAAASGLNLAGTGIHIISPSSPISSTSTSTHSPYHSARGSVGMHSTSATPGWDSLDAHRRSQSRTSLSPGESMKDSTEDYFSNGRTRQRNPKDEPPSPISQARGGPPSRTESAGNRAKKTLQSHGATFATTQPSLPGSKMATPGVSGDASESTVEDLNTFKEPSSSVLRTMIDNGATQQFIAEPTRGQITWANAKFMAYRNASKENIHEQLWGNVYPKDLQRFQNEWYKSLETGEQLSHQVRLKRFDGQYRHFHVRFLPLKDKYGVTKYWHGQAMDIHDLHEAEVKAAKSKEKLASEAKYRALANSLPVIILAASVPTGLTFANTQWQLYSGQTSEDAMRFGFLDHVHPEDLIKCRFPGTQGESAPLPKHHKQEFMTRPGADPLVRSDSSLSSTAESEETVATVRAFGTAKSGQEPAFPNELLRSLAKDGIIMCAEDEQGHFSITTEMRLLNSKGEYRWHLVQGSYIQSVNFGQGEAQWFIACTDISNQKQTEAKIQQANLALEDVNTALEKEMHQKMSYLSSMSHEIRTPLNGIIGNLQFLINSGLEDTAAEWAHGAQEAAKNMHDLINDILDLSKAEANMLQLASHWFSPRSLLEQVLDMLNSKAAEKEIELCFECAEDVPKTIRGDSGRIRQVLLNLVGNAIKFTRTGEVTVRCDRLYRVPAGVELPECGDSETFIRWAVTDTGTGFTPESRKLLFKPYSQIKNRSTRDMGGTGLGLILCKTMVTLHGGSIDATSKPGLGSTFTFFARFKIRQDVGSGKTGTSTPSMLAGNAVGNAGGLQISTSPFLRAATITDVARESPGPLSDSSSSRSITSENRQSMRSSASTTDSLAPMKLTLPPHPTAPRSPDVSLSATTKSAELVSPNTIVPNATTAMSKSSGSSTSKSPPPASPKMAQLAGRNPLMDLERTNFRPPMVSALVVCQAENSRRITCEQIKQVVPRSVPCNVSSVPTVRAVLNLLHGDVPVTFTHIILRLTSSEATLEAIRSILDEPKHAYACVVVLTDQAQIRYINKTAPELDLESLSNSDRLKLVMKPAHTFKLAKIFDPFNENSLATKDLKEAKRTEEKRLQTEAYALFKKKLGNKGIRILAVEDNKLQMDILNNFLAKICCLEVTKAWNGQECLELYKEKDPGYFAAIITDIEMPIMDGLTMCRRIRDWEELVNRAPVPVVSLSANSFAEGWSQSSAAGFSHFCPKPVQFRELGYILLELTDPNIPHKFLSERQMPRPMLKKLGLLPQDDDSDEEIDL